MSTVNDWANQQWGSAELGDKRRTQRAVRLGAQIAAQPDAGLPKQTRSWGDLKAAYRLLHEDDVSHYALSLPHWHLTRQCAKQITGPVLFIQDRSQLNFTLRQAQGLGRIGDDKGQGLLTHSTLAVQPGTSPTILGLAHQLVWTREYEPRKGRETRTQRRRRSKESDHWFGALDAIGLVPAKACWVSVGDRESDIFRYWQRAKAQGWECLLRLVQDRRVLRDDDNLDYLHSCVADLVPQAHQVMSLRSRPDRPARTTKLSLAWNSMRILPPRNDPTLRHAPPLPVWVLRVWEETAPANEKPLEWLLLSTLPIEDVEQAHERALWYRNRWLIEQYHKALKTSCRMEDAQLRQGAALMRLLGLLSIVAVRLLQIQSLARSTPDVPAAQVVDAQLLVFVCHLSHLDPDSMTVYQFWREVARYGGFLGRKDDGEPGWQTLWSGWQYLAPLFIGYLIGKQCG